MLSRFGAQVEIGTMCFSKFYLYSGVHKVETPGNNPSNGILLWRCLRSYIISGLFWNLYYLQIAFPLIILVYKFWNSPLNLWLKRQCQNVICLKDYLPCYCSGYNHGKYGLLRKVCKDCFVTQKCDTLSQSLCNLIFVWLCSVACLTNYICMFIIYKHI